MRRDSARQELAGFTRDGSLRQALDGKLSAEAIDLITVVVDRYCSPRPGRRHRRADRPLSGLLGSAADRELCAACGHAACYHGPGGACEHSGCDCEQFSPPTGSPEPPIAARPAAGEAKR